MTYLLDTHVLLYSALEPKRLSKAAVDAMKDKSAELFYSPISLWEIGLLLSRNRIELDRSLRDFETALQEKLSAQPLKVETEHYERLIEMEFHHKDPFDRLLIAQAEIEQLTLISRDEVFDLYDAKRLW